VTHCDCEEVMTSEVAAAEAVADEADEDDDDVRADGSLDVTSDGTLSAIIQHSHVTCYQ